MGHRVELWVFSLALGDEYLGAVFVVASAECPCDSVQLCETEAKTIAFFSVPLRIVPQIFPELIG